MCVFVPVCMHVNDKHLYSTTLMCLAYIIVEVFSHILASQLYIMEPFDLCVIGSSGWNNAILSGKSQEFYE